MTTSINPLQPESIKLNDTDDMNNNDTTDMINSNNNNNSTSSITNSTPSIPLDWTNVTPSPCERIILPRDVCPYPYHSSSSSDENIIDDLTIIGTHGQKITKMGSDLSSTCPRIKSLILRSHIIHDMEGLQDFERLELLELYDNSIDELEGLESLGGTLRVLDMSYNVVKSMDPVALCPNLEELYLAQNKIKSLTGLRHLSKLRKLDLGANRIRVMDEEELSGLTNLEELWLGKNKIEKIDGIGKLTKLRRFDVQANRLTTIDNLSTQVDTLEEFYLSHNAITNDGAAATFLTLSFSRLTTLDLSRNKLTSTEPFARLTTLEDLWLSGNEIKSFDDVRYIEPLDQLDSIYLEYNPIASEFEYRKRLKEMLPSLGQIDADRVAGNSVGLFGGGIGRVEVLEEKMRKMQQAAFDRANNQKEAAAAAAAAAKEEGGDEEINGSSATVS